MQRFGLVGLPNAGKSTLFNALSGGEAHAAPYAFSTTDSNVGVAEVPDTRLDRLAAMSGSRRAVHASVHFTDIGGLVEGASRGDGLGNAFLGRIRNTDAIVFVLRALETAQAAEPPTSTRSPSSACWRLSWPWLTSRARADSWANSCGRPRVTAPS